MGTTPSTLCSEPKNTQNLTHSLQFDLDPISDESLTNASEIHASDNWASRKYKKDEGFLQYNDPFDVNVNKNRVVREEVLNRFPTSPPSLSPPPTVYPYATVRYVSNNNSYIPNSYITSKNLEDSHLNKNKKDDDSIRYGGSLMNGYMPHNNQCQINKTSISYYSAEDKYKFEQAYVPQYNDMNKYKQDDDAKMKKMEVDSRYSYQSNLNSSKKTDTFNKNVYGLQPIKSDLMQTDRKKKDFLSSNDYKYPYTSYSNSTPKKGYERIPYYQDVSSNQHQVRSYSSQKPLFNDNSFINTVSSQMLSKEHELTLRSQLITDLANCNKSPPEIRITGPDYLNDNGNFNKFHSKIEPISTFSNKFVDSNRSLQKSANPSLSNELLKDMTPSQTMTADSGFISNNILNSSNFLQKMSNSTEKMTEKMSNSPQQINNRPFSFDPPNNIYNKSNQASSEFKKSTDWMESKRADLGDDHSDYTFNFNSNASFSPVLQVPITAENVKMETVILKRFDSFGELSQKREYDYENNLFSNKKGREFADSNVLDNKKKEGVLMEGMETPRSTKRKKKSRDFSKINGFELESLDSQTYENIRRDEFLAQMNEKREYKEDIKSDEKYKFSDVRKEFEHIENLNSFKFSGENKEKIILIDENLNSNQINGENQEELIKKNEDISEENLGGREDHSVFEKISGKKFKEKEDFQNDEISMLSQTKFKTLKINDEEFISNDNQEKSESIKRQNEIKIPFTTPEKDKSNENPQTLFENQLKTESNKKKEEPKKSIKVEEERRTSFEIQFRSAEIVARSEKLNFLKQKMDQILNQTNALSITPKNESDSRNMVIKTALITLLPVIYKQLYYVE